MLKCILYLQKLIFLPRIAKLNLKNKEKKKTSWAWIFRWKNLWKKKSKQCNLKSKTSVDGSCV